MNLTKEQAHILRHMLGLPSWVWANERREPPHRDYFCAGHCNAELHELQRLGLVEMYRKDERYEWFTTTDAGKAAAHASVEHRKRTKAQRRYSRFLDCRDAHSDLTFRDFLTNPHFAEYRDAA